MTEEQQQPFLLDQPKDADVLRFLYQSGREKTQRLEIQVARLTLQVQELGTKLVQLTKEKEEQDKEENKDTGKKQTEPDSSKTGVD